MSREINLDTGLTAQEEEDLLLGEADMDVEIEEDIDRILGEARDSEDGENEPPTLGDISIAPPDGIDPLDPLQLAELVTSTPIKGSEEPKLKSSPSDDTSLERSRDSGLGGLGVLRKPSGLAEPGNGNEPEPKKSTKRRKVVTFADSPGLGARVVGASGSSGRMMNPREKTSLRDPVLLVEQIRPEKTSPGSGGDPSRK